MRTGTKYIGLDVHKASTTMVVLDAQGKMVHQAVMATDGQQIREQIAALSGRKELVIEEGTMSEWLNFLLRPVVAHLVVSQPRRRDRRRRAKDDAQDARALANALRVNNVQAVFHQTEPLTDLRERVRSYHLVTRDLSRAKNRLQSLFRAQGKPTGASLYRPSERPRYLAQFGHAGRRERAELLFTQVDQLTALQRQAQQAMVPCARRHRGYREIDSLPGLGPVRTATVLAVVVTPFRFPRRAQFWSYCGLAVIQHSSGDWVQGAGGLQRRERQQTRGLNPHRNAWLKEVFKSAAVQAIKTSPFREYYRGLLQRGLKESVARVMVARKQAALALHLWKKGKTFDPKHIHIEPV